jgi:uncharacterized membrane protein
VTELVQFFGRFHPVLVHLPIGILLLAGILEVVGWVRRRRASTRDAAASTAESTTGAMLVFGALTAIAAAVAGLMLGATGGYAGDTYERHLRLGVAVAIAASATAVAGLMRLRGDAPRRRRVYAVLLACTILLLTVAGHLGATLAHGEGYLTDHAPQPLRHALLRLTGRTGPVPPDVPPDQAVIYTSLVQPILQSRCVSCHGPGRTEGGLRLDTPQGLGKGGDDGPVVVAGRADSSELVKRIWLPAGHPDVMPPKGHRPPTPAEAAVLRWWIDQGASADERLGDVDLPPDIAPVVETLVGRIDRGPTIPRVRVERASQKVVDAAAGAGFSVTPVADGSPFLYVHGTNLGRACDDARLRILEPLAANVLWLDLSGTSVTDEGLSIVGRMAYLTQLHLQRTSITDAGLAHLLTLEHLESLNLYGTRVTDAGALGLADLEKLRTLYVWQTGVTADGAARLAAARPRLRVELGGAAEPPSAGKLAPSPAVSGRLSREPAR